MSLAGQLDAPTADDDIEDWLRDRVPSLVTHERTLGAPQRRPRVKLVDLDAMAAIAASRSAAYR